MKPVLAALLVFGLLQGCASGPSLSSAARSGQAFAQQSCSRCHAIGAQGASPKPHATPFRDVAQRYDDRTLASEFDALARVGHYEMPPLMISAPDRRALSAYIASFRQAERR